MPYEHIARLPFLLGAKHLTPEELLERAANPVQWAAQRYDVPQHVFTSTAAKAHAEKSLAKEGSSCPASAPPTCPGTPRLVPQTPAPQGQEMTTSQSTQTQVSLENSPEPPKAAPSSGAFFSTVLSSSDRLDVDVLSPLPAPQHVSGQQPGSCSQPDPQEDSAKKPGKTRAEDPTS